MKKILLIDESALFREYLNKKLTESGFYVVEGKNGLDGIVKMRNEMPDLVIMDYFLSRKSSVEVLQEKKANPNVAGIPVIMVASKIDKSKLVEAARFDVRKFFSKPVKMNDLMKAVSEFLKVEVVVDSTPCIMEAHLNDEILFIEIARGLSLEKIDLLKYKINELIDLYEVKSPRFLLMMSDIEPTSEDSDKLKRLLDTILEHGGSYARYMKILTNSSFVEDFLTTDPAYRMINVSDNLTKAMDDLLGLRPDDVAHDEVVRERLLSTSAPLKDRDETFQMRFDAEEESGEGKGSKKTVLIGVVDDDIIVQQLIKTVFQKTGWSIGTYNNGKEFVAGLEEQSFDLIFLDLMMPEMDGFQVLQYLKEKGTAFPIIVLSALSQQETVVKAMRLGVHSFLSKPFKPEMLIKKTAEILNANF